MKIVKTSVNKHLFNFFFVWNFVFSLFFLFSFFFHLFLLVGG